MQRLSVFRTRIVRDLAWAILSPPMIRFRSERVGCVDEAWCADRFDDFHEHLLCLDGDPEPLLAHLGGQVSGKLGKYFENLIAYWLQASSRFEVLGRNLQIRDAKRTYGELDLVVLDRETERIGHWEVAAKFYLEQGPRDELSSWIGPNRRDNLGRKAGHLIEQQATRAELPVARELLAQRGIRVDESLVFLKGRLFHGPRPGLAEDWESVPVHQAGGPVHLHPDHLRSWWCRQSDFDSQASGQGVTWYELLKPNWLADQTGLGLEEGLAPWGHGLVTGPTCLVALLGDREVERGFVVPDDWGEADHESPLI